MNRYVTRKLLVQQRTCLDSNGWRQTAVTETAPTWSIVRQYGFAFLGVRIALHIWSIVRQYGFAFLDFRVILLIIGILLLFLASPPWGHLELIRTKMFLASVAHVDSRDRVLGAHSIREMPRAHSGERRWAKVFPIDRRDPLTPEFLVIRKAMKLKNIAPALALQAFVRAAGHVACYLTLPVVVRTT